MEIIFLNVENWSNVDLKAFGIIVTQLDMRSPSADVAINYQDRKERVTKEN